ncbi:MAG: AI-2E family transporter [Planktomarina sp.]
MALPVATQLKYWGIAAVVFSVVLWFLGNTLLPFILGGAIAYALDPVADRLERMGCSRVIATTIITLTAALMFLILVLLVVPTLIEQSIALFNTVPTILTEFRDFLTAKFPELLDEESTMRRSLISLGETIQSRGGELVNGLVTSLSSLVNVLVLLVIVPVVAFYLLMDWDNMVAKIDELVPRDHVENVRRLGREIDATLASFIRGQGTVCSILGVYYAAGLMIAGLNYGIVVGAVAGLISFIPYVGALVGGVLAIGLALFQFWGDWFSIGVVVVIFVVGQFLEGNILTPKLVGNSIGLHPVWLLFALSVFGSLFGFVGMLVAVPVAAMLGVVARFLMAQYKTGLLYRGYSDQNPDA